MNWYKIFRYPFNFYGLENGWMIIKHAWQRVFRGYDDTASWGLCDYIGDIALPVLKGYRAHKQGTPILDGFNAEKDFKKMKKEWNKKLDKMILALELIRERHSYGYNSLGKNWRQSYEKEQKLIDEGMALFAKHFEALWD